MSPAPSARPARPARLRRLLAGSALGLAILGSTAVPAPTAFAVDPTACVVTGAAGVYSVFADAVDDAAPGATLTVSGTCASNVTIGKKLTVVGTVVGDAIPTLDGGQTARVLDILVGGKVTIRGLTITGGRRMTPAAAPGLGGGIYNAGTLTLRNVIVEHNGALGGGGIANAGTLTLVGATTIRLNYTFRTVAASSTAGR